MPRVSVLQELFRCDLCRRTVDADTIARARRAWQPLIVCESCVMGTDEAVGAAGATATAR